MSSRGSCSRWRAARTRGRTRNGVQSGPRRPRRGASREAARQLGDVRVYAFHGGGEIADMSVFDPFHPDVGSKVEIPYFFYFFQHPQGNVLFDTGGHPALASDPRGRLGDAADAFEVTMKEGDDVVSQLAGAGFRPSDVDHGALSHLHYDHPGGSE